MKTTRAKLLNLLKRTSKLGRCLNVAQFFICLIQSSFTKSLHFGRRPKETANWKPKSEKKL